MMQEVYSVAEVFTKKKLPGSVFSSRRIYKDEMTQEVYSVADIFTKKK